DHAEEGGQGHSPAHNIAMGLSIFIAGLGILLSYLFYHRKTFSGEAVAAKFRPIYNLFWNKYYFDEFYDGVLVRFTVLTAKGFGLFDLHIIDRIVNGVAYTVQAIVAAFAGWFDNTYVDGMVNGIAKITWSFGGRMRRIQTGKIQSYLLIVLGGVAVLVFIFTYPRTLNFLRHLL
ncbi:hypothetical protein IH992_34830, partial [Candidatus Poribacteria bacterium]|nr:hypothetical protein [Candidatus Poribacteria bacterium]